MFFQNQVDDLWKRGKGGGNREFARIRTLCQMKEREANPLEEEKRKKNGKRENEAEKEKKAGFIYA